MEELLKDILSELREIKALLAARQGEVRPVAEAETSTDEPQAAPGSDAEDLSEGVCEAPLAASETPAAEEMMRVFTLNDKVRFRRELFGGDGAAMAETLTALSACDSADLAVALLREKVGPAADAELVADFVSVISGWYRK